jgi:hypothetical protein
MLNIVRHMRSMLKNYKWLKIKLYRKHMTITVFLKIDISVEMQGLAKFIIYKN